MIVSSCETNFRSTTMDQENDVITGKAFHLIDDERRRRASLYTSKDGSPNLDFYDKEGDARIGITVNDYGKSILMFWSKDGLPCIEIMVEPTGEQDSPGFRFLDGDGSAQARLTLGQKPFIILIKDGERIFDSAKVVHKENDPPTIKLEQN
jgi:hypothetical protein